MDIERDLATIAEQERELVFARFDAETAWALGTRARQAASERDLPVAIDITLHAMPVFYAVMNGATPDNAGWVRRKRNVCLRFFRPSYAIGLALALRNTTFGEKYALPEADFAAHGGSFPITVEGAGCIGAFTVSGLPQRDDHSMVVDMLAFVLQKDTAIPRLS